MHGRDDFVYLIDGYSFITGGCEGKVDKINQGSDSFQCLTEVAGNVFVLIRSLTVMSFGTYSAVSIKTLAAVEKKQGESKGNGQAKEQIPGLFTHLSVSTKYDDE